MNTFSKETYIGRRKRLKEKIGSGILLFLGNEESSSNFKDNWYPFRQDSSFLYFFGLDMPGLAAIIDVDQDLEIIFGDNLTTLEVIWQGAHPPISELAEAVGIQITQAKNELPKFLAKHPIQKIHFLPSIEPTSVVCCVAWSRSAG